MKTPVLETERQNNEKVIIHYFSGTGNTYHMIKLIGNRLEQHGYQIIYENIEHGNKEQFKDATLHILSYPIYAFGTPSIDKKTI